MTAHFRLSPLQGSEDADRFAAMLAPGYFGKEDVPRQTLEQTRSFLAANPRPDPRGSYLAWDADTVVGVCAYKLPPSSAGAVEIAYGTFPAYEAGGLREGHDLRSVCTGSALGGIHSLRSHSGGEQCLQWRASMRGIQLRGRSHRPGGRTGVALGETRLIRLSAFYQTEVQTEALPENVHSRGSFVKKYDKSLRPASGSCTGSMII